MKEHIINVFMRTSHPKRAFALDRDLARFFWALLIVCSLNRVTMSGYPGDLSDVQVQALARLREAARDLVAAESHQNFLTMFGGEEVRIAK